MLRLVARRVPRHGRFTLASKLSVGAIGTVKELGRSGWDKVEPHLDKFLMVCLAGVGASAAYKLLYVPDQVYNAVKIAAKAEIVEDRIGFPMSISRVGWSGAIREDRFSLEIPVSGPRGSGKLYVEALNTGSLNDAQQWVVTRLDAQFAVANEAEKEIWPDGISPLVDLMTMRASTHQRRSTSTHHTQPAPEQAIRSS